jgi:hypothetical protein
LVQYVGEELPKKMVNIEDNGAAEMEEFCLTTSELPGPLLRALKTAKKSGINQATAAGQWEFIQEWTKDSR